MALQLDPLFDVLRNGRDPGWCVEITWPWGTRTAVRHFDTEQEALDWIEHHAAEWLHMVRSDEPPASEPA